MKNKFLFKNFISVLIPFVLSYLIFQLTFILNRFENKDAFLAIFILSIYCLIFNVVYSQFTSKPQFTGLMLVGTILKLLFTLIVVFVYSILKPQEFENFSIQLILYYVLFTIFEVRFLLFLISTQTKK